MSEQTPPEEQPRRRTRSYQQQRLILATFGSAIYLFFIWFGITVVGDTVLRSSLMSGLIVLLAGMAYITAQRPQSPEK